MIDCQSKSYLRPVPYQPFYCAQASTVTRAIEFYGPDRGTFLVRMAAEAKKADYGLRKLVVVLFSWNCDLELLFS